MTIIQRMDHFTVVTDQLEATRAFYVDLLQLDVGFRPEFPVPGFWLYANNHAVLHIIEVKAMPEPRRGAIDHIAFWAQDLKATLARLKEANVDVRIIRAPRPVSTWQVFFDDPNGVEVELDFEPAEEPPEDWKQYSGLRGR